MRLIEEIGNMFTSDYDLVQFISTRDGKLGTLGTYRFGKRHRIKLSVRFCQEEIIARNLIKCLLYLHEFCRERKIMRLAMHYPKYNEELFLEYLRLIFEEWPGEIILFRKK